MNQTVEMMVVEHLYEQCLQCDVCGLALDENFDQIIEVESVYTPSSPSGPAEHWGEYSVRCGHCENETDILLEGFS